MSEFNNRPENIDHARRSFWKYDGHKTNWTLDVQGDGLSGRGRRRSFTGLDNSRLMHYMHLGKIHSEVEAESNRETPMDRKAAVIKWLLFICAFWLVFRFVRQ